MSNKQPQGSLTGPATLVCHCNAEQITHRAASGLSPRNAAVSAGSEMNQARDHVYIFAILKPFVPVKRGKVGHRHAGQPTGALCCSPPAAPHAAGTFLRRDSRRPEGLRSPHGRYSLAQIATEQNSPWKRPLNLPTFGLIQ